MSNQTELKTELRTVPIQFLDCRADNAVGAADEASINWPQLVSASAGDVLADAAGGGNLFSACQTLTALAKSSSGNTLVLEKYDFFNAEGRQRRESTTYYAVDLKELVIYELYEESN